MNRLTKRPPVRNALRSLVLSELEIRAIDSLASLWAFDRHPDVADRLARRIRRLVGRAAS
jgi:hypothetical protein